jgi:hypothetical protein
MDAARSRPQSVNGLADAQQPQGEHRACLMKISDELRDTLK